MKLPILILIFLTVLVFSSCQKGDVLKDDFIKDEQLKDSDKITDKAPCFKLVYPVTYIMPDDSEITINGEDGWGAIKAWYEAHPDAKADPVLQYPVKITSVKFDGVKVINNEEEMIEFKKLCDDSSGELPVCDWDGSKVSDPAVWEKHIAEPVVTSADCGGCIVSGVVKYVKINTDFAYVVYYGNGECDKWAYLVTYYGATSDKKETKCKFKLNCD